MQSSSAFALGQRWLSNTESELGLGTIIAIDPRTLTILFPATGESRVYAMQNSPLTRVTFAVGESVRSHEGWELQVTEIDTDNDLLTYRGTRVDNSAQVSLKETLVAHDYQLNQPEQRLFAVQVDDPKWFDLREQCLRHQHTHQTSPLLGFLGARVALIPHQLHIASTVGQRHAPRVLLADEVGLGKTIEAALIIHQQILTNRAQRVLIVVPNTLVHQWLVEMLRRVNLAFAIFDEERCEALSSEQGNPFETEQLVLCSLDFLTHNSKYYQQACEAGWDLMVVDEAHHLTWSQSHASQEYQVVEGLAQATKGVLLLTATPDQLGHESHFARLRLLDPDRFHDYGRFVEEEKGYANVASAIAPLVGGETVSDSDKAVIAELLATPATALKLDDESARQSCINQLLDRHGTGRVLFRNSRSGVKGFPQRHLLAYPLEMPEPYSAFLQDTPADMQWYLTPEHHAGFVDDWFKFDPRVSWFIDLLENNRNKKILTICAHAATALQLAEAVRVQSGIRASVFHEGMSIVERDRAANYFAQDEDGAQVLICSEIGSEGRNFQFAHNLVLFDLPIIPDLLEQRIGRLDRIGQRHDVSIHVPFFHGSAQQVMLDWYHLGLNAFEQTSPIGTAVFDQTSDALREAMMDTHDDSLRIALIEQTGALHQALREQLEAGRDKLLELNSSGHGRVESLIEQIGDSDDSPTLERFMTQLFDGLGILQEEIDEQTYLLRPTESMIGHLPGLDEEGLTLTYERDTATQLEHVHFFSWDHPMVQHAMDALTTDVHGKSSLALCSDKQLPAGAFWLECLFVLAANVPKSMQLDRFMPATPIKITTDSRHQASERTFIQLEKVGKKMAHKLVGALQPHIEKGLVAATGLANSAAEKLRAEASDNMRALLGEELGRLQALQQINPAIRQEEIDFLQSQLDALEDAIAGAQVRLEAIRLVVNNP